MPILPLSFHYCGVYFQSLCKKPRLKKKLVRRAYAVSKNDSVRGSQESLFSTGDGSESNATEVSSEQSLVSTETSGVSSDTDLNVDKCDNTVTEKDDKDSGKREIKDGEKDEGSEMSEIGQGIVESAKKQDLSANEIVAQMEKKQRETHKTNLSKAKLFVIILLITNIPAAFYFSLIHQRGTIQVMKYIYDASLEKNVDVMFLMPCHSTPYYR